MTNTNIQELERVADLPGGVLYRQHTGDNLLAFEPGLAAFTAQYGEPAAIYHYAGAIVGKRLWHRWYIQTKEEHNESQK